LPTCGLKRPARVDPKMMPLFNFVIVVSSSSLIACCVPNKFEIKIVVAASGCFHSVRLYYLEFEIIG